MLIRHEILQQIVAGKVNLAFRRWRRATVKAGGTLTTRVGMLAIDSVDPVSRTAVDGDEARQAGYPSRAALLRDLDRRSEGDIYRIALRYVGADPRHELRRKTPGSADTEQLRARLARLDAARPGSPWTGPVLRAIRDQPGRRAADLAADLGMERDLLKRDVRKLKALGLTESLEVGYRLSPRGRALLQRLG